MTTPNFRDHRIYLVHLLRVLHGKGAVAPSSVYEEVADLAGITKEQRAVEGEQGRGNPVYRNRIQVARQSLVDAGLLISSADPGWQRAKWELNAEGNTVAARTPNDQKLDKLLRERAAEGLRRRAALRKQSRALAGLELHQEADDDEDSRPGSDADLDAGPDPIVEIGRRVEAANDDAFSAMLERVRGMDDRAFEHLVGTVLKAALRAESVRVTPRSKDGGLDGVLQFDALGMRIAVFEAKRYGEDNVIERSKIDAFATVARRQRAAHSLFVTSSRFSSGAVEAAKAEGIRLIDGDAFVELMAKTGIGFQERESFVVYEIDPAWSLDVGEDQ